MDLLGDLEEALERTVPSSDNDAKLYDYASLAPFLNSLMDEDALSGEDSDSSVRDKFSKRVEAIDREDDWLLPEEDNDAEEILSSRRRIYPNAYLNYDDDDYFGDDNAGQDEAKVDKGQLEEEQNIQNRIHMTKKDLESLIYQPDPSLTVKSLSPEPRIAFRKGDEKKGEEGNSEGISGGKKRTTKTPATTTEAPIKVAQRGMKEVVLVRPAAIPVSPLERLADEQQLNGLRDSKRWWSQRQQQRQANGA